MMMDLQSFYRGGVARLIEGNVPRKSSTAINLPLSAFLACNFDKTLENRAPPWFGPLTGQKAAAIVRPPLNEGWHDASHCVSSVCTEEETVLGRRIEPERRRP
jgi:hypothetical protein